MYRSDLAGLAPEMLGGVLEPEAAAQPRIVYEGAVLRGAMHGDAARRFLDCLRSAEGQAALAAHGFAPPPGP